MNRQMSNAFLSLLIPVTCLTILPGARADAQQKLSVAGIIHSQQGGVEFPDGSIQTTAILGTGYSLDAVDGSTRDVVFVDASANVGIGTLTPDSKLAVNGDITAKEVRVFVDGWPDHVFEHEYELMPLTDVAAWITSHGHLPGVPSAREVGKQGVSVGEMQAVLLEKVEELTLHLIRLEDENRSLRDEVKAIRGAQP